MQPLAKQPYVKIIRELTSIEQKDVEDHRTLYLYPDKVVTRHREFLVKDVIDISFRPIGDIGGLLYIHTNKGLFSYTVKTSTTAFIEAFNCMRS